MATAPLCKICDTRHWAHEPHTFNPPASRAGEEIKPAAKDMERLPPAEAVSAGIVQEKQLAKRGSFDRTAYQREYMRKRRQKEKRE